MVRAASSALFAERLIEKKWGTLPRARWKRRVPRDEICLPFKALALTLPLRFFRPQSNNRDIYMKIHEYQAKELLRRFDVKVPRGRVARSVSEAEETAKELGLPVVVKAQIHAGGRGKGGGVKLARRMEDVHNLAKQMIGMNLV